MAERVRVALDAYGGDHGIASTGEGALLALSADPDLEVLFVGSGEGPSHPRLLPVASAGALPDGGHPAQLLRSHPDLSIGLATRLVAEGEADAIVSMGHTGATMITARWFLKMVEGVSRGPAVGTLPLPVLRPPVFLDLGANAVCDAGDLAAFAALGAAYAEVVTGLGNPRVALLANGTEEGKGTPVLQEAYGLLKASGLNFVGYIEPVAIGDMLADVIVTDGFSGNLVIKTIEGIAQLMLSRHGEALDKEHGGLVGELSRMTDVTRSDDPIVLLGARGVVVPGHGRSGPEDVKRAVLKAAVAVRGDLVGHVARSLAMITVKE